MHAHNELGVINRILRFTLNKVGAGELHDDAHNVQMWTILQILTGKLFETWNMIDKRFLKCVPEDSAITALSEAHRKDLEALRDYFGGSDNATNALEIIRNKTAFHYDKLNLGEAIGSVASEESRIYISEHPANSCYYVGSALVFRSAFSMIADKLSDAIGLSPSEKMARGFTLAIEDINRINLLVHNVLYGFISGLLEAVVGGPLAEEEQVGIQVTDVPHPSSVLIPMFISVRQPKDAE
ncbi:hypothetical protein U879_10855 [Defluviimonas sp. 20V17]|nr:hypothetical protein U879_10855 [Defluviimonas sp. 20V17]